MPDASERPKLSEKGLLTPDDCLVTLIDLQPQMLFGVGNFDRQTASLSVLLGIQARLGELALCAFLVPVTLLYHPYWAVGPERLDDELNHFLSNLGLVGGFLMVVVFGAGRFSLEHRPLTRATLAHFHSLRHGAAARRPQAGT